MMVEIGKLYLIIKIKMLLDETKPARTYEVEFNGRELPSGYIYTKCKVENIYQQVKYY